MTTKNDEFDEEQYNKLTGGDKYSWVLDKFLEKELTIDGLEIIGEQYLDLNTQYDRYFYEYLQEQVV